MSNQSNATIEEIKDYLDVEPPKTEMELQLEQLQARNSALEAQVEKLTGHVAFYKKRRELALDMYNEARADNVKDREHKSMSLLVELSKNVAVIAGDMKMLPLNVAFHQQSLSKPADVKLEQEAATERSIAQRKAAEKSKTA